MFLLGCVLPFVTLDLLALPIVERLVIVSRRGNESSLATLLTLVPLIGLLRAIIRLGLIWIVISLWEGTILHDKVVADGLAHVVARVLAFVGDLMQFKFMLYICQLLLVLINLGFYPQSLQISQLTTILNALPPHTFIYTLFSLYHLASTFTPNSQFS